MRFEITHGYPSLGGLHASRNILTISFIVPCYDTPSDDGQAITVGPYHLAALHVDINLTLDDVLSLPTQRWITFANSLSGLRELNTVSMCFSGAAVAVAMARRHGKALDILQDTAKRCIFKDTYRFRIGMGWYSNDIVLKVG